MQRQIDLLKKYLRESNYTVALCGSGIIEECGAASLKNPERAYEIEETYGDGPEIIYTSVFYNTRPEKFFEFYKKELLERIPKPSDTARILARMEDEGDLQSIITSNVYGMGQQAGCRHIINLRGNIFHNYCTSCGRDYSVEYIRSAPRIPRCKECGGVIRPAVSLYGEMMDSQVMAMATREVERAELLLLLGTTLGSETLTPYIKYFQGRRLVIIHSQEHYKDHKADMVIYGKPGEVLGRLGYEQEEDREI